MKKRELQNFKAKAEKEISDAIAKSGRELVESRLKIVSGETKNIKMAKNMRREIAQLKTVLREKTLGGNI